MSFLRLSTFIMLNDYDLAETFNIFTMLNDFEFAETFNIVKGEGRGGKSVFVPIFIAKIVDDV